MRLRVPKVHSIPLHHNDAGEVLSWRHDIHVCEQSSRLLQNRLGQNLTFRGSFWQSRFALSASKQGEQIQAYENLQRAWGVNLVLRAVMLLC